MCQVFVMKKFKQFIDQVGHKQANVSVKLIATLKIKIIAWAKLN